jgi:GTP-binding protein HflX
MLFATLDPTLRSIDLPHGTRVILSDTVGFISDLPTMLVAAFRATLEEVIEADIILHVRDMSHEAAEAQSADVAKVLEELGIDPKSERRMIEVWNKIDRLDAERRAGLANLAARQPDNDRPVLVSAVTGEGTDALIEAIEARLAERRQTLALTLDVADGAGLSWLHRNAEVLSRELREDGRMAVTVRADPDHAGQIRAKFPDAVAG